MPRRTHSKKAPSKKFQPKSRAGWRGFLRFGLVAVPIQAFNAHLRDSERLIFHQLHATCHNRIRHEKVCPVHGPVSNDEVVLGYEYAKDKYVEVDPEEFEGLRSEKDRALTIDAFISPGDIDPIYFDGRTYYLTPDGGDAKEAYAVLLRAMQRAKRCGVGQVIFSGKKQVVLLRPQEHVLEMALLHYASSIQPAALVAIDLPRLSAADRKQALADELVESWSEDHFDLSRYVDEYEQEMRTLIDAKVKGRDVVAPAQAEEPPVYNLMDALRKSMGKSPPRKRAAHATNAHPASRNGRHAAGGHSRRRAGRRRAS